MYSGDEFYGEDVTSPTERPIDRWTIDHKIKAIAANPAFDAWLARLDKIVQRRCGCSLDDLEDFNTADAYEDGYTPSAFFSEVIAPEVGQE